MSQKRAKLKRKCGAKMANATFAYQKTTGL